MTLTLDQIKKCLKEPEAAAHLADLVYIKDQHLSIHRKKYGRGFTYLMDNKTRLEDKAQLNRIRSLVIPPAWKEVRISEIANGHLQVVGRDDQGRKVYLYHDIWTLLRNQTKFFKMTAFAKALPKIRARLQKDLDREGMPLEKCLALVLSIMDAKYLRVGSQYYADKNNTYGLSTLRMKHVASSEHHIQFTYTGKKGIEQTTSIEDPELMNLINQCEDIPGWELFQYLDEKGKHHSIDSGMINDYIHEVAGEIFSAKDFRTWGATREFFKKLIALPVPKNEKEREKNIIKAYDTAAEGLGNTRSVCKQYYVHPQVPQVYSDDTFAAYRDKMKSYKEESFFAASEHCLQEIINEFEIEFRMEADS